ncbi:VWA domain-containing protein [Streptomyces sp. NPDC055056]
MADDQRNADIKVSPDRDDVHLGEEFAVVLAPRELGARDRVGGAGVAYAVVVDDSMSMDLRMDARTSTKADFGRPSRKDVAVQGVRQLLGELPPATEVHIITFGQEAGLRVSGTAAQLAAGGDWPGNPERERGWTNIEAALTLGYQVLDRSTAGSSRVVLVSDGLPNHGAYTPEELAALTTAAADRAVHTDAVGIGVGADFALLSKLAVTGVAEHVASRDSAAEAMRTVASRFAELGRDVVVGSGELSVDVSPRFPVLGVYQLDPLRRRILDALSDGGGTAPSRVRLRLGAVGSGESGQPLFVLRLRAPSAASVGMAPVLRIGGWIGSGQERRELAGSTLNIRVVDNPMSPILRRELMRQVHGLELRDETAAQIASTPQSGHARVYEEAAQRARAIPDQELASTYEAAGGGLRAGLGGQDVANEMMAVSSRSSTKSKREIWEPIPVVTPDQVAPRQGPISLDDEDDEEGDGYGGYSSHPRTRTDSRGPNAPTHSLNSPYGRTLPPSGYPDDER